MWLPAVSPSDLCCHLTLCIMHASTRPAALTVPPVTDPAAARACPAVEWDQLQKLAVEETRKANTKLMRTAATAALLASAAADTPAAAAAAASATTAAAAEPAPSPPVSAGESSPEGPDAPQQA